MIAVDYRFLPTFLLKAIRPIRPLQSKSFMAGSAMEMA